ncbi:hypothetical protein MTYP_00364 [Methylophilaceae bacterium]|nr:hypothetical protein MTYP_00364 [Methylophilaceae bacterium]
MVDVSGTASSEHYSITARPNSSLTPAGALCVVAIISLLTLVLATAFTLIGAWPVLVFAFIELYAVYCCFNQYLRHAWDYEQLTIDGDKVKVVQHALGHEMQVELNSRLANVVMECDADGSCRRLSLVSHGREIEFGRHMSGDERMILGKQLIPRFNGFMTSTSS